MKRVYNFLFAILFMLPFTLIMTACGGDPEKTLSEITVAPVSDQGAMVVYGPNCSEQLDLDDFIVTAVYSDGSTEVVTDNIEMTKSGVFECVDGTGKFAFTYQGKTAEIAVTVTPRSIETSDFVVSGVEDSYALEDYNDEIKPDVTLVWNGTTLVKDTDYSVEYGENNIYCVGEDAGSVTITGEGNYTGEKTITFDIEGIESSVTVEFPNSTIVYDGNDHVYDELLDYNYISTIEGVDTVTYKFSSDNGITWSEYMEMVNAGSYKIKAHFEMSQGYSQIPDKEKIVTIEPLDITTLNYQLEDDFVTFDNTPVLVEEFDNYDYFLIYHGDNPYAQDSQLKFGTDFVVDTEYAGFTDGYKNNINATTASNKAYFAIKGQGNYCGSREFEFEIAPYSVSYYSDTILALGIDPDGYVFTGSNIEPTSSLYFDMDNDSEYTENVDILIDDSEYDVVYDTEHMFAGNHNIRYVFNSDNYTGTTSKSYTIVPYSLDISCLVLEDEDFIYDKNAHKNEFTSASLGALIGTVSQENPEFVKLIYNPTDSSTIKYEIQIIYNDSDYYYEANTNIDPINVGTYYAHVNFVSNDDQNGYLYLNSIKLMKNGVDVSNDRYDLFQVEYTIDPFTLTSANTRHEFVNSDYVDNGSVVYKGEEYDFQTQLFITFANGNTDTILLNKYSLEKYVGTYTFSPEFDSNGTNYTYDTDTWGVSDLTQSITKLVIDESNFEEILEMPTITGFSGDTYDRFKISPFESKIDEDSSDYLNKAEYSIINYDVATNTFSVTLTADNYEFASDYTINIAPQYQSIADLNIFSSIKVGTVGSSDPAVAIDMEEFFEAKTLDTNKYYELYYSEEFLNDETEYTLHRYSYGITIDAIYDNGVDPQNAIGVKYYNINGSAYADFNIAYDLNGSYYMVAKNRFYATTPATTQVDENIEEIYALTFDPSSYYMVPDLYTLRKMKSGAEFGVDYSLTEYDSNSQLIGLFVDTKEGVFEYICTDSLATLGVSDGSDSNDIEVLEDNSLDIKNYEQDTLYLIYYINSTSTQNFNLVQKTIRLDSPLLLELSTTTEAQQHIDIDRDYEIYNGFYMFVDKDFGQEICLSTPNNVEVWSETDNDYISANIYISAYGELIIANTTPVYSESVETGKNVYSLKLRYTYTHAGSEYKVIKNLTIYRESFSYKVGFASSYYEHDDTLYTLVQNKYWLQFVVDTYVNDGDDIVTNKYGMLSLNVMKSESVQCDLDDLLALGDLTNVVKFNDTNDGIEYKGANIETYNINGETRAFLVITYDYTVTDDGGEELLKKVACEKIIELGYAA